MKISPNRKVTEDMFDAIKKFLAKDRNMAAIGKVFGLSQSTVSQINQSTSFEHYLERAKTSFKETKITKTAKEPVSEPETEATTLSEQFLTQLMRIADALERQADAEERQATVVEEKLRFAQEQNDHRYNNGRSNYPYPSRT